MGPASGAALLQVVVHGHHAEVLEGPVVDAVELGLEKAEHLVDVDALLTAVLERLFVPLGRAQISHAQRLRAAQRRCGCRLPDRRNPAFN